MEFDPYLQNFYQVSEENLPWVQKTSTENFYQLSIGCKVGAVAPVSSVSTSLAAVPRSTHASGSIFHENFPLLMIQEEQVVN